MTQNNFRRTLRLYNQNLMGENTIRQELTKIKGIGKSSAIIILRIADIPDTSRVGYLSETQIDKMKSIIEDLPSHLPDYKLSRRNDPITGTNKHLISSDLMLQHKRDIDNMTKLGTWKGIRHKLGLKVRGQRTKSTGRKGVSIGVKAKGVVKK